MWNNSTRPQNLPQKNLQSDEKFPIKGGKLQFAGIALELVIILQAI